MNRFLFVGAFLFILIRSQAQGVTQLPDRTIYRDLEYSFEIRTTKADSGLTHTATLNYSQSGGPISAELQPIVSRAGAVVGIGWSASQTKRLPEGKMWLEIRAAERIRFAAWVYANKNAKYLTPPGSLTVVSPIVEYSETGSTSTVYPLGAINQAGYRITHGKNTRLVTGTFFNELSGQTDSVWRIKIVTENVVEIVGPPGEFFTGQLILYFPIKNTVPN